MPTARYNPKSYYRAGFYGMEFSRHHHLFDILLLFSYLRKTYVALIDKLYSPETEQLFKM